MKRCAGIALGLVFALLPTLLAVLSFFVGFGLLVTASSSAVPIIVLLFILNVLATRMIVKRLFPVARRLACSER
jgi:hypothetical protein